MTPAKSAADRQSESDLGRRYGRIAISALVAALPYRSETKNEPEGPTESQPTESHKDRVF
jgi:hypothetical protein